jgi:hypothetical protein
MCRGFLALVAATALALLAASGPRSNAAEPVRLPPPCFADPHDWQTASVPTPPWRAPRMADDSRTLSANADAPDED